MAFVFTTFPGLKMHACYALMVHHWMNDFRFIRIVFQSNFHLHRFMRCIACRDDLEPNDIAGKHGRKLFTEIDIGPADAHCGFVWFRRCEVA